ncbi:hypothetical protein FFLO_02384 [Filobasidium floriforme]|uniref:SAP domain-containing protein n=1 Tax=Filobasidium floriforme TaxID=5210 RepID=A0A8K0JMS4_9TREE|nr:hypothetical protein FFLO_02384 [Filobasidium floriforme]
MAKRVPSRSTVLELRAALSQLQLDDHGKKETLIRRLSTAYKKDAAAKVAKEAMIILPSRRPQPVKSFLCFDVEATCIADKTLDWPNEVIEFPVILVQWEGSGAESSKRSPSDKPILVDPSKSSPIPTSNNGVITLTSPPPLNDPLPSKSTPDSQADLSSSPVSTSSAEEDLPRLKIVDQFHSYVRPTWRPDLSTFCTTLTGITQTTIDESPTFPQVIENFEKWLGKHGLLQDGKLTPGTSWVTDGPWDLRDFQLHITPLQPPIFAKPYPAYFSGPYIDIKEAMKNYLTETWYRTNCPEEPLPAKGSPQRFSTRPGPHRWSRRSPKYYRNLAGQLEALNMGKFQGRQHSGIDDATNVARILIELARRDVLLEMNDNLPPATNPKRYNWMGEKPGQVYWDRKNG